MAEEQVAEVSQEQPKFVSGEVHVVVDPKDGSFHISAPENIVLALGILETAKVILIDQQKQRMEKKSVPTPMIIRGDEDTVKRHVDAFRKLS